MNPFEIRNSGKYLESLFKNSNDCFFIVDSGACFIRTTPGFNRLLGYVNGELNGRPFMEVLHTDEKEDDLLSRVALHYFIESSAAPLEIDFSDKAGNLIPASLHSVLIQDDFGQCVEAIGIVESCDDNKNAFENEIREMRQNLQSVLENSGDGIVVYTTSGQITLANASFLRMLGYEEHELLGRPFLEIAPREGTFRSAAGEEIILDADYAKYNAEKSQELLSGEKITCRHYYQKKNRMLVPVEATYSPLYDQGGERRGSIAIVRDSALRINLEAEIDASGDFLENVFRTVLDGIIVTDHQGYIVRVNAAVEQLFGLSAEYFIGKHLAEVKPESIKDSGYKEKVKSIFLDIPDKEYIDRFETALLSDEKKICRLEFNVSLLKDKQSAVTGAVLYIRDITGRKLVEQELLRAKRLESISTLAGGIASDFDSILTTVLGNINIVQNFTGADDKNYAYLATAEKEALRAKDLISQLMNFSKNGGLFKKKQSLTEVLSYVTGQAMKGSKVECEFNFASDLWAVEFDREQLIQVLRSLLINADHSMPEGGIIKMYVENYVVEKHLNLPVKPGRYIKITIKDQGIGILNEYIQDIFDPYFKKGRKRSGLVLAAAYSIIKKHNGLISVESEFGAGTTFFIYLPAAQAE